jgi:hypothetical protein
VHPYFFIALSSNGIECIGLSDGVPFISIEFLVILGINYSELATGERDSAEGIAVAEAAIDEDEEYERALDEFRNMYRYRDIDDAIPKFRRQTTDLRPTAALRQAQDRCRGLTKLDSCFRRNDKPRRFRLR